MGYMQWCLHAYIYTRVSLYACHIFRDEANMLAVCTINKNLIYSPEHTTTSIEMGTKMSQYCSLAHSYTKMQLHCSKKLTIFGHLICMHE